MAEPANNKVVSLSVRLDSIGQSDQPVLANYTTVGVAQGMVYLDFGFIEPNALALVARTAREGRQIAKTLEGKRVVRVAIGLDVLQRLQQQLQQVLVGLRGKNKSSGDLASQ